MLFKVYNQNGKVKITKTMNYVEQVMFRDVPEGSMVEIEVGSSLWTKSHAKNIGSQENLAAEPVSVEDSNLNGLMKSIRTLEFARDNQIIDPEEAKQAIAVLKNSIYGAAAM